MLHLTPTQTFDPDAVDDEYGKPTDLVVMGCDGEMSGDDIVAGGRLIQAGYAALAPDGSFEIFNELISWDTMTWVPEAAAVHQIPRAAVDAAPDAATIDAACAAWLAGRGGVPGRRLIVPVGFNVGGWDMPYFKHALPLSTGMLSRRTIDLNALCFTLDGWDPNPRLMADGAARDWLGWKKSAIKDGVRRLDRAGVTGREHDAGYDAALALAAWLFLREQVHAAQSPGRTQGTAPEGVDAALVAVYGAGLLRRLAAIEGIDNTWLNTLAAELAHTEHGGDAKRVGKWFGTRHTALGDANVLTALAHGRLDEVLAFARAQHR